MKYPLTQTIIKYVPIQTIHRKSINSINLLFGYIRMVSSNHKTHTIKIPSNRWENLVGNLYDLLKQLILMRKIMSNIIDRLVTTYLDIKKKNKR